MTGTVSLVAALRSAAAKPEAQEESDAPAKGKEHAPSFATLLAGETKKPAQEAKGNSAASGVVPLPGAAGPSAATPTVARQGPVTGKNTARPAPVTAPAVSGTTAPALPTEATAQAEVDEILTPAAAPRQKAAVSEGAAASGGAVAPPDKAAASEAAAPAEKDAPKTVAPETTVPEAVAPEAVAPEAGDKADALPKSTAPKAVAVKGATAPVRAEGPTTSPLPAHASSPDSGRADTGSHSTPTVAHTPAATTAAAPVIATPAVSAVRSPAATAPAVKTEAPVASSEFLQANTGLTAAVSHPQKLGDGTYQVRAALDPPALGPVDATVKVEGTTVQVNLVAHTAAGHQELAAHIDDLRQSLSQQTGSRVEVTLTSGGEQESGRSDRSPAQTASGALAPDDEPESVIVPVPLPSGSSSLHVIL